MGFIFDGLEAEAYDRSYNDRELLRRIREYFRPQARKMLSIGLMVGLAAIADTAYPVVISYGVDALSEDPRDTQAIALITGVILGAGLFAWFANYLRRKLSAEAVGEVVLSMREQAFRAVTERDLSFYDEFPTGKIASRVNSDTQDFTNVIILSIDLISQVLIIGLMIGILFLIDAQLALIVLAFAPIVIVFALAFRSLARWTTQQVRRVLADVNANIQESVSGISVAKTYRQERAIYEIFHELNQKAYAISLRQGMTFSSIFPILNMFSGAIGTTAIMYFGGLEVRDGSISAGEWFLFIQALNQFWFPLTSIASFWSQFQQGLSSSERVFALIDAEPKVVQTDNQAAGKLAGEIEFRGVDFRYDEKEQVLQNFDLHIQAGETIALVGHTGAGKSSLGKLVARFYEFQGGQILIDGRDIRSFNLQDYRRNLGIVNQTPFLFTGTVRENIRYGNPGASDAEVEAVVAKVAHGDWVQTLAEGLDTPVGERGSGISMGQRQLVALCRVLLEDPAIFILDEATASVDPLTEAQIQEGLDTVLAKRTSIVIAHRLSTIRHADRIIVLDHGRIIEQGTHEALLEMKGSYAQLYNTYFRHQSLTYIENIPKLDTQEMAALGAV